MKDATASYLQLMKKCLTGSIYEGYLYEPIRKRKGFLRQKFLEMLERRGIQIMRRRHFNAEALAEGRDWPSLGHTMVGQKRLDHLQHCVEDVLARNVPGDLIEAGVWRGGASIFMRAILKAHDVRDRCVWVADSFEGLPRPNAERYPADAGSSYHTLEVPAVSLEQVKQNFSRYGLLDEQVRFLKGWFRDTLPKASGQRWAVIRVDGDMYESTWDALVNLYPNLSPGGYVVIDDYGSVAACRQAVHDYREKHGVREEICPIDWTAVFWQRS